MQKEFETQLAYRLLAGAAMLALAVPAHAQEAEEATDGNEIVVTATKRNETIQDVPFSIAAVTAADIQKTGATNIEDISRNVAGLTVQNLGPGQSQVSVRGVSAGQIVRDQPGVKEQVGVYLDESVISLSLFTPDFDLFDLNRVETLRGPQGTLFGSGSVGGTVRYITNQPKRGVTEGTVEAGINTFDGGSMGYGAKGAVNLPMGEKAALRVVAYGEKFGGFIDAIGPAAGEDVNDGRRFGGRVSLLLEPADGIKITPRVIYQDVQANGFNRAERYNLYYNPLISATQVLPENTQYLKLREEFRDKTTLADLNVSIDLGETAQLTSVTSYINRDILVSRDASALTGSVYVSFAGAAAAAAGGAGLASNLLDTTKLKQWTQELRLASTGEGPLQWVIGGFYSDVDRTYAQRLPTPGADAFSQIFLNAAAGGLPVAATYNGFPANSPYNADIPYKITQW
ncbi:MAG: TonB-dependent receptor, partial [Novosphingobium sp.]